MTQGRTSDGILSTVVQGEHLRRRRLVTRVLLRVVPVVAGGLLVTAALIRLLHVPVSVFWIAMGLAVAGVAVFAWLKGRVPAVSDLAASQLDHDAALDGELRSAHWFASNPVSNAWTAFHIERAEARMHSVSWAAVYPPLKTARAWTGSAVLAIAAIAIVTTTAWPLAKAKTVAGAPKKVDGAAAAGIPTDLQKQIDDLIKAIESGAIPMDVARAKLADLREKLSDIDPKMQAAMAKAAAEQKAGDPSSKADSLAEKAEKAAAKPFLPQDMKWSMEDLASKLKYAGKPTDKADGEESQKQSETSPNASGEKQKSGDAKPGDGAMQVSQTAAADAQSTQMMMATMSPGGERGANTDPKKGQVGQPLDLTGALRKETVEADADSAGANVLAEMRKKSEQSHSALGFSRVAPLAAYDKSHATPPPPPSDAVRPLLKKYFIRK